MRITALAGGVGGARFLRGLQHHLQALPGGPHDLTIIGNTGDDITLFGLRVCPDLDTLLYTFGGGADEKQGWGRADESFTVQAELSAYGVAPQWFGLGDQDFATHIARSQWLGQGLTLSEVTARLAGRWHLERRHVRLLPMTDSPVETHVVVDDEDGTTQAIHFQEWWVRHQASLPAHRFAVAGIDTASAAPGVLDAIRGADIVVLPPSNPVVSIGIILLVPGVRDALRGTQAPVVGVSPLVGGAPVRGHADRCLETIGVEQTSAAVAGLYADFLNGWLIDEHDPEVEVDGVLVRRAPLLMRDLGSAQNLAAAALQLATDLREAA